MKIAQESTGAAVALDADLRILMWNREAEGLFGFAASAVHGRVVHEVLAFRDIFGNPVTCFCGAHQATQRGESVRPFVVEVKTSGGERLRVVLFLAPAPPAGKASGLILRFRPDNRRRQVDRRGFDSGSFPPFDDPTRAPRRPRLPALSPAERNVLRLLAEGQRADEVAATLCNSVLTVRNHIQHILKKLGAHNQAQAISMALRAGLV